MARGIGIGGVSPYGQWWVRASGRPVAARVIKDRCEERGTMNRQRRAANTLGFIEEDVCVEHCR